MSAKGGKDWLLKAETTAGGGTFTMVGGLRTTGFNRAASAIDVTNQGSNQHKELLDAAGILSASISGAGVYTNDAILTTIQTAFNAQTLWNFQIVDVVSGGSNVTYSGAFKIIKFDRSGEYAKEQTYSISLELSGSITIS